MTEEYEFSTVGETDFYMSERAKGATHLLIVNLNAPSNLPTILGAEIAQPTKGDDRIVGYMSSKHILTTPHRVLTDSNPMWTFFMHETTLIVMVDSPPVISNNPAANRNEWLFNYPPARDIVMRFAHLERIGTLSTFALNRLFTKKEPLPKKCAVVRGKKLGKACTKNETLQSIWSWLPVQIAQMVGVESALYLMPPEITKGSGFNDEVGVRIEEAEFESIVRLLRKDGFKIPRGAAQKAQGIYTGLTTEALERIKELLGAQQQDSLSNTGAMYQ